MSLQPLRGKELWPIGATVEALYHKRDTTLFVILDC